jgi:hypothetical protein
MAAQCETVVDSAPQDACIGLRLASEEGSLQTDTLMYSPLALNAMTLSVSEAAKASGFLASVCNYQ